MNINVIEVGFEQAIIEVNGEKISSRTNPSSCRNVFLFDDFVVKFDSGNWQNAAELDFYNNHLQPEDAKYFPKLLGNGKYGEGCGTFMIQERVFPSKREAKRRDFQKFFLLKKKYRLADLSFGEKYKMADDPNKQHFFNCMMTRDGFKVYDIGMHYARS